MKVKLLLVLASRALIAPWFGVKVNAPEFVFNDIVPRSLVKVAVVPETVASVSPKLIGSLSSSVAERVPV